MSRNQQTAPGVWPVLHYDDTERALRFLVDAPGFSSGLVARDEAGAIVHAELGWPEGGTIVFGSTAHTGGVHGDRRAGAGACYVVAADVDAVHARAERAGAEIVERPHVTRFGSGVETRACTVCDPEGNLWTFGTYDGTA